MPPPLAETARHLIRATRMAVLATIDQPSAAPFASLVTQAPAPDLSPLLWLSALARHTRNLARDPRCSLLLAGPPASPNPQTAPRVTLRAIAARCADPALLARWHALNPYAASYAGLPDFSLWKLTIEAAHVVGGFAAAADLEPAHLAPAPDALADLAAAEAAILAHCNTDHPDAMDAIAAAAGGLGAGWKIVALDPDGFDLAREETLLRVAFAAAAATPAEVRAELVRLARLARATPMPGGPGAAGSSPA